MNGRRIVPSCIIALALAVPLVALAADTATAGATTLVVGPNPGEFHSIQSAVDAAQPGDVVLVSPGVYAEAVTVVVPGITIRGVDRETTILDGGTTDPRLNTGITVVADGVTVESLTLQNYASNGVAFSHVDRFYMYDNHAKDNDVYGLYAIHSTRGEIAYNFAEGHGDGGIYIGETPHCDCDVHHNEAWHNVLAYSGTANSYVRIWANDFHDNRAAILMSVLPNEMGVEEDGTFYGTQVHSKIYRNWIHDNNYRAPPKGITETITPPVGEGITISGGWFNEVYENVLENNELWGIGIHWLVTPPRGNHIHDNWIDGSRYGVWWDEWGEDHCFNNNVFTNVDVVSDPDPLPTCPGPAGDLPCPVEVYDWVACRASDVRGPSAIKEATLAWRSLTDAGPYEDPLPI